MPTNFYLVLMRVALLILCCMASFSARSQLKGGLFIQLGISGTNLNDTAAGGFALGAGTELGYFFSKNWGLLMRPAFNYSSRIEKGPRKTNVLYADIPLTLAYKLSSRKLDGWLLELGMYRGFALTGTVREDIKRKLRLGEEPGDDRSQTDWGLCAGIGILSREGGRIGIQGVFGRKDLTPKSLQPARALRRYTACFFVMLPF